MNVKLIAIAALGKRRQIGVNGDLPWSIPDEYRHYLDSVRGQHVLIGRKNFEGHGGDVEGALPLILTRDRNYKTKNGTVLTNLSEIFQFARDHKIEKIFVIGGAEIYKLTLPFVSEFLWSEVEYDGPADAWFPEFQQYSWETECEEKHTGWTMRKLVKTPEKL